MRRSLLPWTVWVGSLLAACPAYRPGPYQPKTSHSGDVPIRGAPQDVSILLEEADVMAAQGPSGPDLARSLACADEVLSRSPQHEGAAWRAARALFFLSLRSESEDRARLAARCMDVAQLATSQGSEAESFYYAALCMGARARARNLEGLELLPDMVEAGKRARRIDPQIVHGGPDRLLGGIYLRAPAWPTSVGDLDEALAHLEGAIQRAPDWPENHLLFAEALAADDRHDEARDAFARAKAMMGQGRAEGWHLFWKEDIERLKRKLGCR